MGGDRRFSTRICVCVLLSQPDERGNQEYFDQLIPKVCQSHKVDS